MVSILIIMVIILTIMVTIFIILIIIRLAKGEEKKGEVLARLDQLTKERKQLLVSICGNLKKEEEKSKNTTI